MSFFTQTMKKKRFTCHRFTLLWQQKQYLSYIKKIHIGLHQFIRIVHLYWHLYWNSAVSHVSSVQLLSLKKHYSFIVQEIRCNSPAINCLYFMNSNVGSVFLDILQMFHESAIQYSAAWNPSRRAFLVKWLLLKWNNNGSVRTTLALASPESLSFKICHSICYSSLHLKDLCASL